MNSVDNPFFSVIYQNNSILSWKQNKTLSIVLIGLATCITFVLPFLLGVVYILGNFPSSLRPSFGMAFNISISMNLLMIFVDITSVSILFNQSTDNGYVRIQSLQELASKKLRIVLLVILLIVFLAITDRYWFPTLTLFNIISVLSSIGLLILSFATQFFTIGMFVMGLAIMRNSYTITIDYNSKRLEKENVSILKKTKTSLIFDELTSLNVRPIGLLKLRWELVLTCKDKTFQILIADKELLTEYAKQLQVARMMPHFKKVMKWIFTEYILLHCQKTPVT